jgi:hypothetical protein
MSIGCFVYSFRIKKQYYNELIARYVRGNEEVKGRDGIAICIYSRLDKASLAGIWKKKRFKRSS